MSHRRRKLSFTSQNEGLPEGDDPGLPAPLRPPTVPPLVIEDFNLEAAERRLCVEALSLAGNLVGAAQILKITRHALKRRIVKHGIQWPRVDSSE